MKRRRVLCLVTAVALLAAAFLVVPRGSKEPVYQGKTLTQWINEAHDVGIFEQTEETDAAMSAFGTNAVPFLLNEFTRPIRRWRGRLYAWVNGHPSVKIHLRTDEARVRVGGLGLILLGTNAAPALPVLARYLDDPHRRGFVRDMFYCQGDAALPYLAAAFASTNAAAITNVLVVLQYMAHRSVAAQEAFAAALSHPSPTVRAAAVPWSDVLTNHGDVVPRLVALANDPSPLVRQAATNQLVWRGRLHAIRFGTTTAEAPRDQQTNPLPKAAP
jgi:hypothetical protein